MRYLLTIVMLLATSVLFASEIPGNPDRFTSVSFSAGLNTGSGDYTLYDANGSGASESRDLVPSYFGFSSTLIHPMTEKVSILLAAGYSSSETEAEQTDFFFKSKSKYKTFKFSIGFKLYLH